jgi:hypothetical protein
MSRKIYWERTIVTSVLFLLLAVGGGLLMWGGSFARGYVHDQLAEQKITFPAKGSPGFDAKTYPGLQRYAGQAVDNGPKAKAYANQYIKVHLAEMTPTHMTYSQASTASRANPTDTKLAAAVQNLFRGETLRGLLLNAWGWSVVGSIAGFTAWAAFAGAALTLVALFFGLTHPALAGVEAEEDRKVRLAA